MSKEATSAFLADLINRRGNAGGHSDTARLLELLFGATIIEPTAFEPDPATHRHDYYYNAVTNTLYKKVISTRDNLTTAHWQKASI